MVSPPAARSRADALAAFLSRGNLLVKVGVLLLFFGVAFLLKYAAATLTFPPELRLLAVGAGGVALVALGWRLRHRRPPFALALQGGGIGILYLTVYGALRLYGLLPPGAAFALLFLLAAGGATLAVAQDSIALAVLGSAGGFLAPLLASTGEGSHVLLFGYYAVLNLGILAVAWFRAWRLLNLVGFVSTFGISILWGYRYYRPEHFATVEPFVVLFFLLYVADSVLFALRRPPDLKDRIDGTLVFGPPIVAAPIQAALVIDYRYGLAWSAAAVALLYFALTLGVRRSRAEGMRELSDAFFALGVVFASLAIPLAFDGRWSAAAWAVEGAGILWIGVRQGRRAPRLFGAALQLGAGLLFLFDYPDYWGTWPVLNAPFLGGLLLTVAGFVCARQMASRSGELPPDERWIPDALLFWALLFWALLWWTLAGVQEIRYNAPFAVRPGAALLYVAASCAAWGALGKRLAWPSLRSASLLLLPAAAVFLAGWFHWLPAPSARGGIAAWPLAAAAHIFILRRQEGEGSAEKVAGAWHAAGVWLGAVLLAWEGAHHLDALPKGADTWPLSAWAAVPPLFALVLLRLRRAVSWPLVLHGRAYLLQGAAPILAAPWLWTLALNLTKNGSPRPLPYVPLLNPLDLAVAAVHLALFVFWRLWTQQGWTTRLPLSRAAAKSAFCASLFLWLTAAVVRTVHHWGDVPFKAQRMIGSTLLQASLSLTWSVTALALMIAATRRGRRTLWLAGAALLGATVLKLFVFDLSGTGTVARIVSFLGVGGLLLLVGYLSPVPPRGEDGSRPDQE